jgi:hypothetical protein
MNVEELAAKHQDNFPGYELVDFYDAAVPSYAIQLQVLVQEQRPLSPVDEFVLRTIDVGQVYFHDVVKFLGLEEAVVRSTLNRLQRSSYIAFVPGSQENVKLLLTTRGRRALSQIMVQQPILSNLPICQDALTGQVYVWRPLRQANTISELGLHVVPTFVESPKAEQLPFSTLQHLARKSQSDFVLGGRTRELACVIALEKYWTAYRIMRILQYVRPSDGALQLLVFDGSERSPEHAAALLEMQRQKRRPLRAYRKHEVPETDETTLTLINFEQREAAKRNLKRVPELELQLTQKQRQQREQETKLASPQIEERQEANFLLEQIRADIAKLSEEMQTLKKQAGPIEVLEMHQHRPKLIEALIIAKQEIILISPWMTPTAVDDEIMQTIGKALSKGVNVLIGYGFGKREDTKEYKLKQEDRVTEALRNVARGKKGQLRLFRFDDLHSKVLICDESFMIITSFNWLSFKGDPTYGSRQEHGTLIRARSELLREKQRWLNRFTELKT